MCAQSRTMAIAQYSSQKKSPRRKAREFFLVLQRGFPLSGINFDSPGATGKKSPRQKARRFFGAPAGISPIGDELRLPGSSRKKILPPKGERIFLVLQRGFPLSGMNFDSPGAAGKKFSRRKAREFFWCSSGDSNPNRITRFQCLSLSDNTFDNFLLRFTYRLTLLCTCCLRLSSRSV